MNNSKLLLQQGVALLSVFSLTLGATYVAERYSGEYLISTPYTSRSTSADSEVVRQLGSTGPTTFDAIVTKVKTEAGRRASVRTSTVEQTKEYNAYIDKYLNKLDKLDNDMRKATGGNDYAFIFQYIYPRVLELKKVDISSIIAQVSDVNVDGTGASTTPTTTKPQTIYTDSSLSTSKNEFKLGEKLYGYIEGGDINNTYGCIEHPLTSATDKCLVTSDPKRWEKLGTNGTNAAWNTVKNGKIVLANGFVLETGWPTGQYTGYTRTGNDNSTVGSQAFIVLPATTNTVASQACKGVAPAGAGVRAITEGFSAGGGSPTWTFQKNDQSFGGDACTWTCENGYTQSGNTCVKTGTANNTTTASAPTSGVCQGIPATNIKDRGLKNIPRTTSKSETVRIFCTRGQTDDANALAEYNTENWEYWVANGGLDGVLSTTELAALNKKYKVQDNFVIGGTAISGGVEGGTVGAGGFVYGGTVTSSSTNTTTTTSNTSGLKRVDTVGPNGPITIYVADTPPTTPSITSGSFKDGEGKPFLWQCGSNAGFGGVDVGGGCYHKAQ